MNIGDGDGGLLASIYAENEARRSDPAWMDYKRSQGQETFYKYVAEIGSMQEHVLPYLQSLCSLEERAPEKTVADIRTEPSTARAENITAAKAGPETGQWKEIAARTGGAVQKEADGKKPSIHECLKTNKEIIAKQAGNAVAKGKDAEIVEGLIPLLKACIDDEFHQVLTEAVASVEGIYEE